MRRFCSLFVAALCLACGPSQPGGASAESGASSDDPESGPSETTDASQSNTDESETTDVTSTETMGFVTDPSPDLPEECDVFAQDCSEGSKCVPWVETDGSTWLGFTCVPVLGDQAPGEPCTLDFSTSADDCDATSSCFSYAMFDGVMEGHCHAFCTGSTDDPMCEPDADYQCVIGNGYPGPALCVPKCDPLQQDCGAGLSCHWLGYFFGCTALEGEGGPGEACAGGGECSAGQVCMDGEWLPDCAGSCCTPYCALSLGDEACAVLPGTSCVPFFEQGMAPAGYEDIGACLMP